MHVHDRPRPSSVKQAIASNAKLLLDLDALPVQTCIAFLLVQRLHYYKLLAVSPAVSNWLTRCNQRP
jgi:hypothetical protein